MKAFTYFTLIMALAATLSACSADADSETGLSSDAIQPVKLTVPAGTRLRVTLIDAVSTSKSSAGDSFMASLADDIMVGERKVLEKGMKVRGRVVDVKESGRVKGVASIRLILTDLTYHGENMEIATKPFIAEAESTKKRDAGIVAGGAGVGAVVGAIADGGKGAGLGALVGGAAGTGAVLATKGKDLNYPPETRLTFTLDKPIEL